MSSRSSHPAVVLVTGASSGIGRATAAQRARGGHHLVLVARGEEDLALVAAECDAAGAGSTMTRSLDVGVDADVAACVRDVLDRHGRIDEVVSAAGVAAYGRVEEVPAEVFDGVIRTNLLGAVNLTRHVIPVLRRQRAGTVLYVGSVVGHMAVPTFSPYVVSKWGLRSLVRQVQLENRDLPGVRVRYVAPGAVDTPIYRRAANYSGWEPQAPWPVSSVAKAAGQVVRRLGPFGLTSQLSVVNYAMTGLFKGVPWAYDRIVGPAFARLGQDQSTPAPDTTGNVLRSRRMEPVER
jgi:NAD(P)-dependent dehydrogenase (short-subunit alcohol dehydrogenase family)